VAIPVQGEKLLDAARKKVNAKGMFGGMFAR
jgi:hypothetical protein